MFIHVDDQQHQALRGPHGGPPRLARHDAVLAEDCIGVVENKRRAFKCDTAVFLLVCAVLLNVFIQTASLYEMYNRLERAAASPESFDFIINIITSGATSGSENASPLVVSSEIMHTKGVNPAPLSVVVPAYNEERTLAEIVARLLALPAVCQIVLVNDCSTDRTGAIADRLAAENPRVTVVHHPKNRGKTEALKTGFSRTTGEIVIVQDADLEYDPSEIADVIAPILEGHADVVYGSRFLVRKASRVLYFYHYIANKGLTFLSNLLTNINMTDVETCYKAFRGEIIRNMRITSSGFGFEIEVTAKVAKLRGAIYEVPISYHGRTYEQGKKIGMKDGIAALWYIVRFNLFCSLESSYTTIPETTASRSYGKTAIGASGSGTP